MQRSVYKPSKILWVFLFAFGILFATDTNKPFSSRSTSGFVVDNTKYQQEYACVLSTLWHEARGEPEEGQRAVMQVIINRKKHKNFPSTFCEVIKQDKQFSFLNGQDHQQKLAVKPYKALDREVYRQLSTMSHEALQGRFKPVLEPSVLWYAHYRVRNHWTKRFKVVMIHGNHKFYKES